MFDPPTLDRLSLVLRAFLWILQAMFMQGETFGVPLNWVPLITATQDQEDSMQNFRRMAPTLLRNYLMVYMRKIIQ